MGFLGFFGNNKPSEKAIQKQVNHAKEHYAKNEYRQMAMEKLLEWGTKDSLLGLLGRFTVVVQSPHWDEEEKTWLVEELKKRGDLAKEVLIEFLKSSNSVTHALKVLVELCSEQEFSQVILSSLKLRSPEDHQTGQGKLELIMALDEYKVPGIEADILPYLNDHNDDVKCATIEVLRKRKNPQSFDSIVKMLSEDFHSARVLRMAANTTSRLKIPIRDKESLVSEVLEDFQVSKGTLHPLHQNN